LHQIIEVSIDMSENYKCLVHKLLPNAQVVADRFHVMKLVNQDLDAAQKHYIKPTKSRKMKLRRAGLKRFLNKINMRC
jgi:transposase